MAEAKKKKAATKKPKAARKRSTTAKPAAKRKAAGKSAAAQCAVLIDRRSGGDRRKGEDRRKNNEPVVVERRKLERRAKVNRRRQIDPTTCERDYTDEEIQFMNALDDYKRASGRMFPTCSEILEVIRKLGYEKRPGNGPAEPAECASGGEPKARIGQVRQIREAQGQGVSV